MSIQEIKQRVNQGITEYMHPDEKAEIYRNDAKLLLEKNQRLVEALELSDLTIEGILETLSTPLHQTETGTSRLMRIEETMRRHQFYKQNPADWAQFKETIEAYKLLEKKG